MPSSRKIFILASNAPVQVVCPAPVAIPQPLLDDVWGRGERGDLDAAEIVRHPQREGCVVAVIVFELYAIKEPKNMCCTDK